MKVSLVVMTEGKTKGQAIPIKIPQFIIGRDPQCNLRPASAMISKRHCAILVKGSQVFVRDFESTNGTFVNEVPVKGEVPVKDEDTLRVGPLLFQVAVEGPVAVSKPTPPPSSKPGVADVDDAAAMLLSLDDDAETSETTANSVPSGTTVFDLPVDPGIQGGEPAKAEGAKKPEEKKPSAAETASQAAAALWDKLRRGQRR